MTEMQALEQMLRARPRELSIEQRRAAYDALGDRFPVAPDVTMRPEKVGAAVGEWSLTPSAREDAVVLYLHGGGYVYGSLQSHRHLVTELGRSTGAATFALDYRRAPEAPFPAALEDAVEAYRLLLSRFTPSKIAVAGDSAGGGLAVAMLVKLKELSLPQPSGCLLLSPWVDMSARAKSYDDNSALDPVVSREIIKFVANQYLGDLPRETPLASPIFADLRGIARLVILAGATETLLDDSLALARAAALANVRVTLDVWPHMFHIWPTYYQMLREGLTAVRECGTVLSSLLRYDGN